MPHATGTRSGGIGNDGRTVGVTNGCDGCARTVDEGQASRIPQGAVGRCAAIERLVARARDEGTLREDVTTEDVLVLLWATARVVERTEDIARGRARRFLAMHLDGLRASAATPPPAPPLTARQLGRVRRTNGAAGRR